MIETYVSNWNYENPCFRASAIRRYMGQGWTRNFQTLCNGATVFYFEHEDEDSECKPICYVREFIPHAYTVRIFSRALDTEGFPF